MNNYCLYVDGKVWTNDSIISTLNTYPPFSAVELVRFGKPEEIPEPKEIAHFGWYGIGRNHDDKIKVKCEKKDSKSEVYRLSWPKSIELDSTGITMVVAQANGENIEFFDYMKEFIQIIESNSEK